MSWIEKMRDMTIQSKAAKCLSSNAAYGVAISRACAENDKGGRCRYAGRSHLIAVRERLKGEQRHEQEVGCGADRRCNGDCCSYRDQGPFVLTSNQPRERSDV